MIERLNGRPSVLIAIAGLLLVVLVGWLGFVSPQRSKAAELAAEIDQTEARLIATQALVDGPALERSTAELAALRRAIPDEVQMSQILRQLSAVSADARVRVLGITPQPTTTVGTADLVSMNVNVEGRYFAIREFLRILRGKAEIRADDHVKATGRLFAVDQIEFTGATSKAGSLIQATLTVNAFAFSGGASATPTPGTAGTTPAASDLETSAEAATP